MSADSKIEWTDHTFNPWWGCVKVSPACTHCYAERDAHRHVPDKALWGPGSERRFFGPNHWHDPVKWNAAADKIGQRARVFCASMADVFEDYPRQEVELKAQRARLWALIETTPSLDWLLLTKRPENILRFIPEGWKTKPRRNVWYGTTAENQEWANKRIPELVKVPAAVRFLSVEPLLGPVDVREHLSHEVETGQLSSAWVHGIDWVIVGGESGPHARPMNPEWVNSLRHQCADYGTPFFFKQWGEWSPVQNNNVGYGEFHGAEQWVRDCLCEAGTKAMYRNGKKAAGRKLLGSEWSEFPTVAR